MRRRLRLALLVFLGLLVTTAAAGLAAWVASRHVPPFYAEASRLPAEAQREAGLELEAVVAALMSDARRRGEWQGLVTDEQLNGWLGVELPAKHPAALPGGVHDPRLKIGAGRLTLAVRVERGPLPAVYSIEVEAYVSRPNVLALKVCRVRAGHLPLPSKTVLSRLERAARGLDLPLKWARQGGDPVALVSLPGGVAANDREVQLETLQLEEGELYVAGRTVPTEGEAGHKTEEAPQSSGR